MTRDEFEAALWRRLGGYATPAIIDAILQAADAYRNGAVTETPAEAELRRQRRHALDVAVSAGLRTVHFQVECCDGGCTATARACNRACWKAGRDILTTTIAADVTCSKCQRSTPYLEALAGGLEAAS